MDVKLIIIIVVIVLVVMLLFSLLSKQLFQTNSRLKGGDPPIPPEEQINGMFSSNIQYNVPSVTGAPNFKNRLREDVEKVFRMMCIGIQDPINYDPRPAFTGLLGSIPKTHEFESNQYLQKFISNTPPTSNKFAISHAFLTLLAYYGVTLDFIKTGAISNNDFDSFQVYLKFMPTFKQINRLIPVDRQNILQQSFPGITFRAPGQWNNKIILPVTDEFQLFVSKVSPDNVIITTHLYTGPTSKTFNEINTDLCCYLKRCSPLTFIPQTVFNNRDISEILASLAKNNNDLPPTLDKRYELLHKVYTNAFKADPLSKTYSPKFLIQTSNFDENNINQNSKLNNLWFITYSFEKIIDKSDLMNITDIHFISRYIMSLIDASRNLSKNNLSCEINLFNNYVIDMKSGKYKLFIKLTPNPRQVQNTIAEICREIQNLQQPAFTEIDNATANQQLLLANYIYVYDQFKTNNAPKTFNDINTFDDLENYVKTTLDPDYENYYREGFDVEYINEAQIGILNKFDDVFYTWKNAQSNISTLGKLTETQITSIKHLIDTIRKKNDNDSQTIADRLASVVDDIKDAQTLDQNIKTAINNSDEIRVKRLLKNAVNFGLMKQRDFMKWNRYYEYFFHLFDILEDNSRKNDKSRNIRENYNNFILSDVKNLQVQEIFNPTNNTREVLNQQRLQEIKDTYHKKLNEIFDDAEDIILAPVANGANIPDANTVKNNVIQKHNDKLPYLNDNELNQFIAETIRNRGEVISFQNGVQRYQNLINNYHININNYPQNNQGLQQLLNDLLNSVKQELQQKDTIIQPLLQYDQNATGADQNLLNTNDVNQIDAIVNEIQRLDQEINRLQQIQQQVMQQIHNLQQQLKNLDNQLRQAHSDLKQPHLAIGNDILNSNDINVLNNEINRVQTALNNLLPILQQLNQLKNQWRPLVQTALDLGINQNQINDMEDVVDPNVIQQEINNLQQLINNALNNLQNLAQEITSKKRIITGIDQAHDLTQYPDENQLLQNNDIAGLTNLSQQLTNIINNLRNNYFNQLHNELNLLIRENAAWKILNATGVNYNGFDQLKSDCETKITNYQNQGNAMIYDGNDYKLLAQVVQLKNQITQAKLAKINDLKNKFLNGKQHFDKMVQDVNNYNNHYALNIHIPVLNYTQDELDKIFVAVRYNDLISQMNQSNNSVLALLHDQNQNFNDPKTIYDEFDKNCKTLIAQMNPANNKDYINFRNIVKDFTTINQLYLDEDYYYQHRTTINGWNITHMSPKPQILQAINTIKDYCYESLEQKTYEELKDFVQNHKIYKSNGEELKVKIKVILDAIQTKSDEPINIFNKIYTLIDLIDLINIYSDCDDEINNSNVNSTIVTKYNQRVTGAINAINNIPQNLDFTRINQLILNFTSWIRDDGIPDLRKTISFYKRIYIDLRVHGYINQIDNILSTIEIDAQMCNNVKQLIFMAYKLHHIIVNNLERETANMYNEMFDKGNNKNNREKRREMIKKVGEMKKEVSEVDRIDISALNDPINKVLNSLKPDTSISDSYYKYLYIPHLMNWLHAIKFREIFGNRLGVITELYNKLVRAGKLSMDQTKQMKNVDKNIKLGNDIINKLDNEYILNNPANLMAAMKCDKKFIISEKLMNNMKRCVNNIFVDYENLKQIGKEVDKFNANEYYDEDSSLKSAKMELSAIVAYLMKKYGIIYDLDTIIFTKRQLSGEKGLYLIKDLKNNQFERLLDNRFKEMIERNAKTIKFVRVYSTGKVIHVDIESGNRSFHIILNGYYHNSGISKLKVNVKETTMNKENEEERRKRWEKMGIIRDNIGVIGESIEIISRAISKWKYVIEEV